jgi:hypothetical protein
VMPHKPLAEVRRQAKGGQNACTPRGSTREFVRREHAHGGFSHALTYDD